jgi:diacylglycerol kinase (ATP)
MRAAAILGPGCSAKNLTPFQTANKNDGHTQWQMGVPAASDQADVVLLFGGDGTIHRHLSALVSLALPVLMVPVGSGNDFARALGLCNVRDSVVAWRQFCAGRETVRAIDLGMIKSLGDGSGETPFLHSPNVSIDFFRYFCSVAGVGLDGEVTRRADRLPRWLRGHGGYALSILPTLFHFAPFPMKIAAQDAAGQWAILSDQPSMLAAFANTATYGGGMKIAPRSRMDDGKLDVCVIGGIDPFKLVCFFPTVYLGRHLGVREVQYFQASRLRVETRRPLDFYADGEYVGQTPMELGVHREALKVITC